MANSANDLLDKIEDTVGPLGDDEEDDHEHNETEISSHNSTEVQKSPAAALPVNPDEVAFVDGTEITDSSSLDANGNPNCRGN